MAVKRRGEFWRNTIGKFPDNKIDKNQREVLNARYRNWFLMLKDETILPHALDRRAERASEAASDQAVDDASAAGHMHDLIEDYLQRHISTLKTSLQVKGSTGNGRWIGMVLPIQKTFQGGCIH
jgi:hypothetical protein